MPRQARLDAPGVLHHVMVRGSERRAIVLDDTDRQEFLDRLAGLSEETVVPIFAWSLLPSHAHLLLRRWHSDTV
jgi:putative transposase